MHWITIHEGLTFTWTAAMDHVAGETQKTPTYKEVAPKQTPLHCSYTECHHGAGQSLWLLSCLLTRQFLRMTCNHVFDTRETFPETVQWDKPVCTPQPGQMYWGHPVTCHLLPSKTEEKIVLIFYITLRTNEPQYSTELKLTISFLLSFTLTVKLISSF